MLIIEQALLEQLEDELHRAARPPETLLPDSPEAVRQRRMASVMEELKSVPLAPVELKMLMSLDDALASACDYWDGMVPFDGPGAPNVTDITLGFLAQENYNYRDNLLYDRMSDEYAAYLTELAEKDPQTIIDNAYQIVMKEDILSLLEKHDLELPQIDVLLTLESPLSSVYHEWLDNDYSHMDMLHDTLVSFAEREKAALACHAHDENGEVPERLRDYYATYEADPEPTAGEDLEL